jgi:hypothetical protein
VKEVLELGQSFNYDPGYTEGKNAGALEMIALRANVMQGEIQGRTTVGEVQRDLGIMPAGARLTLGIDPIANSFSSIDYKLNQLIDVSSAGTTLPAGFRFGDALPADLVRTARLDPALLGRNKVANLEIFSNQAVTVRDALRVPQGGSVRITAESMAVGGDIDAPSGSIVLNASRNDLPIVTSNPLNVTVADGVTLSARGAWVNELRGAPAGTDDVALVNGGKISLSAQDNVALGKDTLLDVTGGSRLRVDGRGKVIAGNGGEISLSGNAVSGLDANVRGFGIGSGGTLSVSSNRIQIGGTPDHSAGTVNLDTGFFERAGFANIHLAGIENLTLSEGVRIKPTVLNIELQPGYTVRPSGSRIEDFSRLVKLDDLVRQPANLSLAAENIADGTGDLLIGAGAHIDADPRASVTLKAAHLLDIEGRITAPGGTIAATLDHRHDFNFDPRNSLWLGKQALLDVSGVALTYLDNQRLTQGMVLNGGDVILNARLGTVVAEAGSSIRMAGVAPVRLDILNQAGGLGQWIGSDAGSLSIMAREGVLLDGSKIAQGGGALNRGGAFSLVLGDNSTPLAELGFPTGERILSLAQTVAPQTAGLTAGGVLPARLNGQARLGTNALEAAGFDRIAVKSRDAIRLENDINLGAGRGLPLKEVVLDAPRIETAGGNAALKAETLRLGNYDIERVSAANTPAAGSGTFSANAQLLELAGNLTLTGMGRAELTGSEEVSLSGVVSSNSAPAGTLSSAADLLFRGAVIAPATYSQISIQAPGRTVAFSSDTAQPVQPLSALGSLTVTAANIVQGGNIWAPLGQLNFNATDTLTFKDGSLTSIAATQGNGIGSLIPFGMTVNGRSWVYSPDSFIIPQLALPEKSIRIQAASVDMQRGATVNLSGGGDLQAYEFSVGPGGARDILNDANIYAILPGYSSRFAPGDRQENTGFGRTAGDAVYLSGIPGLDAGVYTLLPAHYALLPGAYAVRLNADVQNLLPGQAYSRQDGIQVVPGYITDSRAVSGGPRDALWSGFEVLTREQVLQRSEINLTRASHFFSDGLNRPQDAGLLSVDTTAGLKLDAAFRMAAAEGGRGGALDISAPRIVITGGAQSGIDPGDSSATRIETATLNALGAASLFLGGTRSASGNTTTLKVGANEVILANDGDALKSGEVILAAKDTVTLKSGGAIDAQGGMNSAGGTGSYRTAGNGALVRAASTYATFSRTDNPDRTQGTLTGEAGSLIRASSSIILDATKQNTFAGTTIFADRKGNPVAGNLSVGATRVNFGSASSGVEGLVLDQRELDRLNNLNSLALTSYSTFDLYGDVNVGGIDAAGKPTLQMLNLQGAGLAGVDNEGKTATLHAGTIQISNPVAAPFTPGGTLGNGSLAIQADRLVLGEGAKAIQGFSRIEASANELVGRGAGSTDVGAGMNLSIARVSGEQSASQTLIAAGQLNVANLPANRTLAVVGALGAKWTLSGTGILFDTRADLPSGMLKLAATAGNLELGKNADLSVAGKPVAFFDVTRASPGGTIELASDNGNILAQTGARMNVSGTAGGDAGSVIIHAPNGTVAMAGASLLGSAAADAGGTRGEGGRFELDVASLSDFSTLNTILNQGGFDGARAVRVRTGDVSLATDDTVKAKTVQIAADGGKLNVAGHIDVSGETAGSINLYAKNDVAVLPGARLDAYATASGKQGGKVEIGTAAGRLNLAQGSALDVHGGSSQAAQGGEVGEGGKVLLRAPRTGSGAGNDVAVDSVASSIGGAKSVVVEAVKL